jgi:toxin-antitoxin system PIN domain toxin
VKIPDVNVLLYARDPTSPQNAVAQRWLEQALSGDEPVGFAIVAVLGFVRISTLTNSTAVPLSVREAFDDVEDWLAQPPAKVIHSGPRHIGIWRSLLEPAGTAGNLTTDAHLAALAIENNATLASFDGDMHRFSGLKLEYLR